MSIFSKKQYECLYYNNRERFTFNFIEPYSCDTPFVITLGDKRYRACLSDWSTNFNKIRLEIENSLLTYYRETEIKLYFEDSPTIIRVRSDWENIANITIVPNDFINASNIYARCEPRKLIVALYLGLLEICITLKIEKINSIFIIRQKNNINIKIKNIIKNYLFLKQK